MTSKNRALESVSRIALSFANRSRFRSWRDLTIAFKKRMTASRVTQEFAAKAVRYALNQWDELKCNSWVMVSAD